MTEELKKKKIFFLNHPPSKIRGLKNAVPAWGEVLNFGRVVD